jgi:putative transposase
MFLLCLTQAQPGNVRGAIPATIAARSEALPAKVSQHVLRQVGDAWKAFREAKAVYEEDPSRFTGRPRLPNYKHKTEGRNIDLGVTNLAAITSNREGFIPRLVNGRTLKARNQWYNKRIKELKLCLPKEDRERVTKQMERLTNKRNRQVNHYLHAASKCIIDFLVEQGVGTIIVGKNPLWKQEVGMGRRNNQNFVAIPHARFIDMLMYKAALVGIQVEIQEGSYTSVASFLDLDPIPTYKPNDDTKYTFSGKRIGRRNRLYRTKDGKIICADVNGSYNILRKRKPDAFAHVDAKGLAAYVVQPSRLAV